MRRSVGAWENVENFFSRPGVYNLVFIHNLVISSKIYFFEFFLTISSKFLAIFLPFYSHVIFSGAIWHQKAIKKSPAWMTVAFFLVSSVNLAFSW